MKNNEPTKTKKAMKTIKFLSIAALALVGAMMTSCSSDDNIIDNPQQPENKSKTEILTTTVGFDDAATTRALASGGVKTFAAGETMAIVYKNNSGNTVKAVSEALESTDIEDGSKSAKFTFTLDDPDKTKPVMYIYPAAMAKGTIATDATIDAANTVDFTNLDAQNGTLATLSASLDLATYSAAWENGTSLPAGTLVNQLAVCALTLKNSDGSSTITSGLTQVTVSDGSNSYTVAPTSGTFSEDVIYVAIRPVTAALQYTATDGTTNYLKTATSREYAAGNFYNLGLRMELPAVTYTAPTLRTGLTFNGNKNNVAGSPQDLVNPGSVTNGTMYYSTNGGSSWSTGVPTQTNAGSYTVYYKVEPDAGYSGVASTSLGSASMAKANGWCSLSPSSSSGWNSPFETFNTSASISHHGGTLTYSIKGTDAGLIPVSISGNTLFLTKNVGAWHGCTVTVTSAATTNYNAASATYTCND